MHSADYAVARCLSVRRSRVRLPDAHNCRMFNAPLLGNGRRHRNRNMADMSRTWWDATTQVASRPPLWILKILIFDHVTVITVLIYCRLPNFNKIGLRVRPPDAHICWMCSAALLGNGRCHGNHIMRDMSETWWNATNQASSKSVHW